MKFTIEKNIIVENLANVVKAISAKNIIPILNGIKLELEDDGLYLTASDSELTIRSFIPNESINKVENKGSIIIQSKFILDIIRKLPSDLVNFELMDGLKIRISSDNSQYDLNCLDPKEYPSMKLEEKDKPIIIKGDIFMLRNFKFEYYAPIDKLINSDLLVESYNQFNDVLNYENYTFNSRSVEDEYFKIWLNSVDFQFETQMDKGKVELNFGMSSSENKIKDKNKLINLFKTILGEVIDDINDQLSRGKLTNAVPKDQYLTVEDGYFYIRLDGEKTVNIEYVPLCFDKDLDTEQMDGIISDIEISFE